MALLINKTIQLHDELDRRAETTRKQDIQIMHQKRELRKIKRTLEGRKDIDHCSTSASDSRAKEEQNRRR